MLKKTFFVIIGAAMTLAACKKKEINGRVWFIEPTAGAEITSPVKVRMGVEGMTLRKSGGIVEGTGHHHVLVNRGAMKRGELIPKDKGHIHFGKGTDSGQLELEPGKYQLTLQFADGEHQAYGPKLSASIQVTVKAK